MNTQIDKIITQVRPKIQTILRTIGIYSIGDMIQQFKTHVWGNMEYANGAILHATDTNIQRLDQLQNICFNQLNIIPESVFLE